MVKRFGITAKKTLAVLLSAVSLFVLIPSASAQEGGSGLSISPTRAELTIESGKADFIKITLKNISGVDITAKAVVNDFSADNATGEPKIVVDPKIETPASIKNFIVDITDVDLKKDETKTVDVPVQVPENAISGAYYGVIRYTATPNQRQLDPNAKQVALNASLGIIVLIEVPGNITERVAAERIGVERSGKLSSIFISAPLRGNVELKNAGNGFSKPFGKVSITKGSKEVFSYNMNAVEPKSNILPGATRIFKDDIKNVSSLGRYTITANVSYGRGGDILTLSNSFWVFPLWFVLTFVGVLVLLIVLGFLTYRWSSRRRHHRRR